MKSLGLKFFTDTHWTLIALVIFVVSYIVLILLQQKQYRNEILRKIESLPLEEKTDEH